MRTVILYIAASRDGRPEQPLELPDSRRYDSGLVQSHLRRIN